MKVGRLRGWVMGIALSLLAAGCTATGPMPAGDEGAGAPAELAAALNVAVAGDSVRLELHVTNTTGNTLEVEFATAQRYDFAVRDGSGAEMWRWSGDQMFAQVLGTEALLPGESRRYSASWPAGGREGEFEATGRLTSTNYPVALRTPFRLPTE